MAEVLDFKCPQCGGQLEFDAKTQNLKCPYCDSVFSPEYLRHQDAGLAGGTPDTAQPQQQDPEWGVVSEPWESELNVYICNSCGGEIISDENTISTACPYCGNPVVLAGRVSGVLKPDYVIPFKLDKKDAKAKMKRFVESKKFAPSLFKSENKLKEIKGIYVPYWLFDSEVEASINFVGTHVRHWSDSDYNYTETSFFDVYRAGSMRFENVPVDGSTKMPDDLMESLEPFDFKEALDFQTAYLSGYLADKYDVPVESCMPRADERTGDSAESVLRSTVNNYATLTTKTRKIQRKEGRSKYALYPVWILNTMYQGKKYTFAMNGQTGKFIGNLPISKKKVAALFSAVAAASGAVVFGLGCLIGMF